MDQQRVGRILIVDDDDAIRSLIEKILKREKFEVDSARDGFEAIEKLRCNEYAMILLDLMMPRVDGHGVLRYLASTTRTPRPAVIVMTANLQSASDVEIVQPVARILPKPFDIRHLVTSVRECFGLPTHQRPQFGSAC